MNKVLVVVDMQNDFITGALGTKEAQRITPYVISKIAEYHTNGDQVIFTRDTHDMGYLNTQEGRRLPVAHCVINTEGWQLAPEIISILDIADDIIIDKPTFGGLDLMGELEYIEDALGSIEVIELVGLCTGICVIANAVLAKTHFIETTIIVDANGCACVTPKSHKTALEAMKLLQIEIIGG